MVPLFQIPYKAGLRTPPVNLICQSVFVDGELLLWIDGINAVDPIMIPLSAVSSSRMLMSFEEYIQAHKDVAREVLLAGRGELSPAMAARAIAAMKLDPNLKAADALELVSEQALDLIDADNNEKSYFWGVNGITQVNAVRRQPAQAA